MKSEEQNISIRNVDFEDAVGDRYLAYALSTIMSRSLPDVRDGLKPVHRRVIYAMQQLKINPNTPFKKCARIVGDVMGKFHPHGDAAIYGALVRLAQDFSVRYPLIEGQGNFGNIDGDGAAAMRYTEARLSEFAHIMMDGIDDDCVDFRLTYDGEGKEPIVFPSFFPNLLANGSTGIAVGMATSIPPHNLNEIYLAIEHLIDNPNSSVKDLMNFVIGPDFPTGGILIESKNSLLESYETGKGTFKIRSRWHKEDQKGGSYKIIIDQIPYMVEKSKIIEKIANLIIEKKNNFIDDVQDESADDIRIVLYPKNRNINPEILMESLFKSTDLESRFSLNMNALDSNGIPRVMNLKEVLNEFISHCKNLQLRQSKHRVSIIESRLNLLRGFLVVYLNLDEVISIIRESDDPKKELIERFSINDDQAESILNMRLRSLRKLQEIEIKKEIDDLQNEKNSLNNLIEDEKLQMKTLKEKMKKIRKNFDTKWSNSNRLTVLNTEFETVDIPEEAIEKENITIVCSDKNWIRSIKGHEIGDLKYKDGDFEKYLIKCSTIDKILIFASNGRSYTIDSHKIPFTRGYGESLRLLIDIPDNDDVVFMCTLNNEEKYLVSSSSGYGFVVEGSQLIAQTKNGKQILNLKDGEKAIFCKPLEDNDTVVTIGTNRKMIAFSLNNLPILSKGRGVILQKYKSAQLSDIQICKESDGFYWKRNNELKCTKDISLWISKRGAIGRLPPLLFPRNNKFNL